MHDKSTHFAKYIWLEKLQIRKFFELNPNNWRNDLRKIVIRYAFILGVVVYINSLYAAFKAGFYGNVVLDSAAIVAIFVLNLPGPLPSRWRAGIFCLILYGLGVGLLISTGPISQIFLFGFSTLATLLLGLRAGLFAALLSSVTLFAIGSLGYAALSMVATNSHRAVVGWVAITLDFTFVNSTLTLAIGAVLTTLDKALKREVAGRLSLEREHALLRTLIDALPDVVVTKDSNGVYLNCNPAALAFYGLEHVEELAGKTALDFFPREIAELHQAEDMDVIAGRPLRNHEIQRLHHANGLVWYLQTKVPLREPDGAIIGLVAISRDINDRKQSDLRLVRLNRLHTVLSKVSQAFARGRDRQYLYNAVCRIVVEDGLLRMAFVAEVDADAQAARPVASHGADLEYLRENSVIPVAEGPLSKGTVGAAFRTGSYDVCNDIGASPRMRPRRDFEVKRGLLANASFPFRLQGEVIGVLVLYAEETGYFQSDEIELMVTVVDNLTFALEALEEERQRHQAEVRSNQLAAIVDSSEDAIVGEDLNGVVTSWNKGAETIFGYAAEEMVGASIMRLVPADRLNEENDVLEKVLRGESVKNLETLRLAKSGRLINVSVTASPIMNNAGEAIGASKVAHDITQIKVSEARFRRLTDSNAQSVFFWNTKGEITDSNDAFLRLSRYTRDDLKSGKISWAATTPPEYAAADRRALAEVAAHGICAAYEKELVRTDGTRTPILIGAAIFEDNRDEGVCFVLDLTERNKLEQQLRQSQKMESLGQLTGGIAHDFNNLLGIIQINLELIGERLPGDPDSQEMAGMALQAVKRGANLTHQLLAFARKQPLQPKTVNIETLLSGMTSLLRRTLGATIKIETILAAGLWTTTIDPHQLENALLNLALNSLHAMPEGGSLIIEASNVVLDETYVEKHGDALPGDYVMVSVTDTGVGISSDLLERVLEPFFTTRPVGKGSGLGLSMVLGFLKQSGGHLKIHSELGHGATVNLYLPRASADVGDELAAPYQPVSLSAAGEMVLVVEDDQLLRSLTLRILNDLGYRTMQAEDGPAARAILAASGHVDLLLTDVVLPEGMSGPELARSVRSHWPATKVLYMSGYPRDATFADGRLEDQTRLLMKPFSKAELAHMVRNVIDEGALT